MNDVHGPELSQRHSLAWLLCLSPGQAEFPLTLPLTHSLVNISYLFSCDGIHNINKAGYGDTIE